MTRLLLCLLLVQAGQVAPPAQTGTPAPVADALIYGRVVDPSGAGVSAATVALQPTTSGVAPPPRVLTDDEGRYFFDRLTPGPYLVNVTKIGWVASLSGKRRVDGNGHSITLAEHERKSVDVTTWKLGAVSGTLVDEAGEPIVDVEVRAVRRALISGQRQMVFAGTARTDDRGVYRISGLTPAQYSVFVPATVVSGAMTFSAGGAPESWLRSMTGEGTAPLAFNFDTGIAVRGSSALVRSMFGAVSSPSIDAAWLAFPPSFAGAPGVAGATTVTLSSGQERIGIDMQLRLTPTYPVSGVVQAPDGPASNLALHLMSAGLEAFPLFDVATATTDGSGAFTFFGVPPGDYVIRVVRVSVPTGFRLGLASSGDGNGFIVRMIGGGPGQGPPPVPVAPMLHATERVTVGSTPIKGLQLSLQPGPRVTGRVEFTGNTKMPAETAWRMASASLEHANGYRSANPPYGPIAPDGTFALPSVLPGDYYVRVTPPQGWTVKTVTWQGHNVLDAPLALSATNVTDVVVTLTDHPGTIGGTVYGQTDQPATTAVVLIFPVSPELWTDYGVSSPRIATTRVNADGTFRTGPLADGEYHMIAVADEQASDWLEPATLSKLKALARQVVVREGESSNETLKLERIK